MLTLGNATPITKHFENTATETLVSRHSIARLSHSIARLSHSIARLSHSKARFVKVLVI